MSKSQRKDLLESKGLVKIYKGRKVVNGISLRVRRGEIVGLLGPNGAGKTTTFYMIVGLVKPDEGEVFLNKENITDMPMYKRARIGIGYLPQEESIFRRMTVEDNIKAVLELRFRNKNIIDARTDELISELGLEKIRKQKAYTLSGGEKRRVEVARILATDPKFLLLDEPFTGIDPIAIGDIQDIVKSLKDKGIGILITDHNVRETLRIVDRAYLVYEGRILMSGSAEDLINSEKAKKLYLGRTFE